MPFFDYPTAFMFAYQPQASLSQPGAVQDTWYTILDTTEFVRLYGVYISISAANEDLATRITIDGQTIVGVQANAAAGSNYKMSFYNYAPTAAISNDFTISADKGFDGTNSLDGKSVKIEVRKTTNNGAGTLTGVVMYGILESVVI